MKIISALIDFTETSKIATKYACHLATLQNAKVNLLHITSDHGSNTAEVEKKLLEFTGISEYGLDYTISVGEGDYLKKIPKLLQLSDVDIVVIGTHGTKGIFQTLFGANVLKLVQGIRIPAIVVQDTSPDPESGFKRILFPMAPHTNFQLKIDETARWAKLLNAQVEVFCLFKGEDTLPENIQHNLDLTKATFEENGVNFSVTLKESVVYSVGYAREILDHAESQGLNLISIMSQNSEENLYFGNVDKTNIILNSKGIPVLCIGS